MIFSILYRNCIENTFSKTQTFYAKMFFFKKNCQRHEYLHSKFHVRNTHILQL